VRAYYNDNDPFVAEWLRGLVASSTIPRGVVDGRSISEVSPVDLVGFRQAHFFAGIGGWPYALEIAGWPTNRTVWTASCPCQPFSTAGRMRGEQDERHLWPHLFKIVRKRRPPVIFGEQVAGIGGESWLDRVSSDLESEGYAVGASVIHASSAGAPHARPRIFFVADTPSQRHEEPWEHWANPCDRPQDAFREADRLVNAFRRSALPFLCTIHDGLPGRVGRMRAYGNAIVPRAAAIFIRAYMMMRAAPPLAGPEAGRGEEVRSPRGAAT